MNYENFTLLTQKALKEAALIAKDNNHKKIDNGHIFKGILNIDKNICIQIYFFQNPSLSFLWYSTGSIPCQIS